MLLLKDVHQSCCDIACISVLFNNHTLRNAHFLTGCHQVMVTHVTTEKLTTLKEKNNKTCSSSYHEMIRLPVMVVIASFDERYLMNSFV